MPVADPIYLDNNATAPLRAEAVAAIHQAMGPPANPSSVHGFGRRARLLVEDARQSLGLLIGCRAQDVVFTSGGTEANNLALSGFSHVITSAIEHDSVLQAAPQASLLPVTDDGLVDLAALKQMVTAFPADQRDQTIVSVMAANNETGVIQPLAEIAEIAREAGLATHSDMVQLLGKTHIDLTALGIDFASFSAHKIGGPTGVGALVVRPGMRLTSLLRGGGQEQGRRSGTEKIFSASPALARQPPLPLVMSRIFVIWRVGEMPLRLRLLRRVRMLLCLGPLRPVLATPPVLLLVENHQRPWSWPLILPVLPSARVQPVPRAR